MLVECDVCEGLDGLADTHVVTDEATTTSELSELHTDILEGVQFTTRREMLHQMLLHFSDYHLVIK